MGFAMPIGRRRFRGGSALSVVMGSGPQMFTALHNAEAQAL